MLYRYTYTSIRSDIAYNFSGFDYKDHWNFPYFLFSFMIVLLSNINYYFYNIEWIEQCFITKVIFHQISFFIITEELDKTNCNIYDVLNSGSIGVWKLLTYDVSRYFSRSK